MVPDRTGLVHNGRVVVARLADDVSVRVRKTKRGKPCSLTYTQRTGKWLMRCLSCGSEVQATWQQARLKGCHRCAMFRTRKSIDAIAESVCWNAWRSGARSRGIEWMLTREQVRGLIGSPCHYCGVERGNSWTRHDGRVVRYNGPDRVDSSLPYVASNVVPCCGQCNRAKGTASYDDFVAYLNRIAAFRPDAMTKAMAEREGA